MFFLIPRQVSKTTATLWVAAVDESKRPDALVLEPQALGTQTRSSLEKWPASGARVHHQEITVSGLKPGNTYAFALQAGGDVLASARVNTLPRELPVVGEKPFTVMLGSCFAWFEDKNGKVGKTYLQVPPQDRPDVKILAGDQVYLDNPFSKFLVPRSSDWLRDDFLNTYLSTWGQTGGFADVLASGANYFASDDHEFWNNAPNKGSVWVNTWTAGGRKTWWDHARALYGIFQTSQAVTTFDVPPLSFCIADTRINRRDDRSDFMTPADLAQVGQWIRKLEGPGVLVVGQPVLRGTTGFFKGNFGDWNLPDYNQYHELSLHIAGTRHSLAILTGDVHFGRIARSRLRSHPEVVDLVEIISSPMSLVSKSAAGKWDPAPPIFPPVRPGTTAAAMLPHTEIKTEDTFDPTDGHFLTLEFTRQGAGVNLGVRYWPIIESGGPAPDFGKEVWKWTLR